MNAESLRIASQLRHAFAGDPWHGDPLRKLLDGVTAQQASTRPLASGHSIWELVLHIDIWVHVAFEATQGVPMPKLYGTGKDWFDAGGGDAAAWSSAVEHLFASGERLAEAIAGFEDSRLEDIVPGREYDFYYLFHGIVQHSLYHGGQIAMLKKATSFA